RLIVADQAQVSEPALKALGARGIVRPSDKALQVVLGPIADTVAGEIRAALGNRTPKAQAQAETSAVKAAPAPQDRAQALLAALGGPANLRQVTANASRLRLVLDNPAKLDQAALAKAGTRGSVQLSNNVLHVVVGSNAEAVAEMLRKKIG
ncbi:MAG: PTS transporter subunit EIIB, partial [Caulobacter sp.]|nr:PTS transporter subunit EIIB [Caulobacter sp.]